MLQDNDLIFKTLFKKLLRGLPLLVVASISLVSVGASASPIKGKLLIDGEEKATLEAGKTSVWTLSFYDDEGQKVTKYKAMHAKLMHMVIISEDYSHFAHVHPTLIGDTGDFNIVINQASADPDNAALVDAVPFSGRFHVIAEVMPQTEATVPPMRMAKFNIEVIGDDRTPTALSPTVKSRKGDYTKYFKEDLSVGSYSDTYKVNLRVVTDQGCSSNLVKFYIDLFQYDLELETYKPVRGLVPWLMMGGHMMIAGTAGDNFKMRPFGHMHAMLKAENSALFTYFDRGVIGKQMIQLWMQFKQQDKILTFPIALDYQDGVYESCE